MSHRILHLTNQAAVYSLREICTEKRHHFVVSYTLQKSRQNISAQKNHIYAKYHITAKSTKLQWELVSGVNNI